MPWTFRCHCGREMQKHYVLEQWVCACGATKPPKANQGEVYKCGSISYESVNRIVGRSES